MTTEMLRPPTIVVAVCVRCQDVIEAGKATVKTRDGRAHACCAQPPATADPQNARSER